MTTPATAPVLIGRDAVLAELLEAHASAAAGDPGVVVVAGDAGLGKTTLVEAFLQRVPSTALVGNCVPVMSRAMPFVPVIQALRELGRALDANGRARMLRRVPAVFARLMPDAAAALPQPQPQPRPLDDLGSGADQLRLFGEFVDLLGGVPRLAGTPGPVVMVVEDVHWADRSTLDLLGYLARNLSDQPALLVLTVRSDDLSREHPVRGWLAELQRLPVTRRVPLEQLTRTDTAMQIAGLLGRPAEERLVEVVHRHAAGNPLFTEQLLPWAEEPGRALPENLRDLVAARFADLPEDTRSALQVAAVLGRVIDLDILVEVLGEEEEHVEAAVLEAVDRQLLLPGPGDGYTFRHPLFREVLIADLMPSRRRRLHRRAAEALERHPTDDPGLAFVRAGHVARHWEAADAPELAFGAAVRAGLAAQAVYAFPEADEYLARAVRLADQLALTARHRTDAASPFEGLPVDEVGLLARTAQVAHIVGDQHRAVDLADRAVELCRAQDGPPERLGQLLERQGFFCYFAGHHERADGAFKAALTLLPADPPSAERARLLADLAMVAIGWSRLEDAECWGKDAAEAAEAAGARRELGMAYDFLGLTRSYSGQVEEGLRLSREAVAIAEETGDPDDLAVSYINLSHLLGELGRYDEAVELGRGGFRTLSRLGLDRQEGSFLQANVAEALVKAGRFEEADAQLAAAHTAHPRGMLVFPLLLQSTQLAIARGDLDQAARLVAQLQAVGERHGLPDSWLRPMDELRAELALWQRDGDRALGIVDGALGRAARSDDHRFGARLVWLQARTLADLADRARAARDLPALRRVQALGERLAADDPAGTDTGAGSAVRDFPETSANGLTTRAELTRLSGRHSPAAWTRAVDAWAALGTGPMLGYSRWRLAEATVMAKSGTAATVAAVRDAYALAREQGAQGILGEVVALAKLGRVDLGDDVPDTILPPEPAPDTGADIVLTPREREVLTALVAGKSNGQIAADMFISVKTASVHVSNILRKLGVSGREEAARLAYRMNLTDPPG